MDRSAPRAEPALRCGNCGEPMQRLELAGHYAQRVELDLCGGCHLVWFDHTETAHLSGAALLELIGAMAAAQTLPHRVLRADAGCARCRGPLKTVHNRTRFGPSLQLECVKRHGSYQTFAEFLSEKGLLRPMSRIDRAALLARQGQIDCVNCGAAIDADEDSCSHCRSVPSLLDVARLARALDPEGALDDQPVHALAARQAAMQCGACGAALPEGQAMRCAQCGATLAISRLAQAHEHVRVLGPALRAHAQRPAPQVVKRRLEALDADLPRRREWVAKVEAETREQRGGGEWNFEGLFDSGTNPLRAVLIALAIWFVWWYW
jgi:predicted nucleic acid-binding Zn ribbon protein/Zn-finger nucleic acid-binding protein